MSTRFTVPLGLMRWKRGGFLALVVFCAGCTREHHLTVGSKNFTEQLVLGELIAQHLERALHIEVRRKLDLGGTLVAQEALTSGSIDLYPEYTGTALTSVLKQAPVTDPKTALERVRAGYRPLNIEWIDPLGFENTFAMAVRRETAQKLNIRTLSEAARHKPGWKIGVGYEFERRPDGLAGLLKAYDLKLAGSPKTMDLGLLYKALEQKDVDLVAGNSTDGLLSVLPVVTLTDDRRYFPPYEAAIAVRSAALSKYSGLREALGQLTGRLNTNLMRRLNYEVDGKHRPVREVAQAALAEIAPR